MKILTIVGPTAVGKTTIATEIAQRISGEIISADSRQIFKYLNIGTAKPTAKQRRTVKFHLIDFIEPDEDYSCGQFARDAEQRIAEIATKKKLPLICGGTGLYIKALFHPLDDLPRSDNKTKKIMNDMLAKHGIDYMYRKLQRDDPGWAKRIKGTDKQRILRALEVYHMTGQPISKLIGKKTRNIRFLPYYIGLNLPREKLYQRINERFDQMIVDGLVAEVKSLLVRRFLPQSSALRTIGYREIIEYLQGMLSLEQAIEKAKRRTRNYAKRQITWFNKMPGITWHDPEEPGLVDIIIESIGTM
jgi:tRNA dimethylallyltransferase